MPPAPVLFDEGLRWGVASSAFQAEGGAVHNDWGALAREGRSPPKPGNGLRERAEPDLRLLASLGVRNDRLPLE